ncbi:hypothetical protein CYMTET_41422 [Cymbomonas tetramitiformis]|uniref:Uncharacterized protein n=1 Tax=Cymbomonas tetramitiformis TaxID=36881 RepID=A0AAE0F2J9_9CHLO|nr:hypothetical protein CYMTET_41422 [Cymbomonas tetramitiformis]
MCSRNEDHKTLLRVFAEALSRTKLVILDHGMLQNSQGVAVSRSRAKELLARAGREAAEELAKRKGPTWAVCGFRKILYDETEFGLTFVTKGKSDNHVLHLKIQTDECQATNSLIATALSTEQPTVTRSYAITQGKDSAKELVVFDTDKHLMDVMHMAASPNLVRKRIKAWRNFRGIIPTMPWNRRSTDSDVKWLRTEIHTTEQVRVMVGVDGEYYVYGDGEIGNFEELWRWLFANDLACHTRWYYQRGSCAVPFSPGTRPIDWIFMRGNWSSMNGPIVWITRVPRLVSVNTGYGVIRMYIGLFRIGVCMMLWRKRATERVYHPRNLHFACDEVRV